LAIRRSNLLIGRVAATDPARIGSECRPYALPAGVLGMTALVIGVAATVLKTSGMLLGKRPVACDINV
jgi:hypothetical protein